jgi:hypothetical protein
VNLNFCLSEQNLARDLNLYWKKTVRFEPGVTRNSTYFCQKNDRQKIVSIRVRRNTVLSTLPNVKYVRYGI